MDREILNEDEENQAITREELIEEIVELKPIVGSTLNVPLSEKMIEDLNNLLLSSEAQCTSLAQQYITKAWTSGPSLMNTFLHEEKVKILVDALELLADNNLLSGIGRRRDSVNQFLSEANTRINEAKEFHLMSEKEVRVHKVLDELFIARRQTDSEEVARKTINAQ